MPSPQGLVAIGQTLTYLDFMDFVARPSGAIIMLKDSDHRKNALCSCIFLLQQFFHSGNMYACTTAQFSAIEVGSVFGK
jgi:hypothetical protein